MACSFRNIECDKYWGTIYKSPGGILTDIVQVSRSFHQDLRGRLRNCSKKGYYLREIKNSVYISFNYRVGQTSKEYPWRSIGNSSIFCATCNFFSWGLQRSLETNISKKAVFSVTKDFGLFFLVLSSVANLKEHFKMSTRFYDNILHGLGSFLKTKIESKNFWKMGCLSSEEKIWPSFSRIIESDNCHGAIYKGWQGILTNIVQTIRSFLEDQSVRWTILQTGFFPD